MGKRYVLLNLRTLSRKDLPRDEGIIRGFRPLGQQIAPWLQIPDAEPGEVESRGRRKTMMRFEETWLAENLRKRDEELRQEGREKGHREGHRKGQREGRRSLLRQLALQESSASISTSLLSTSSAVSWRGPPAATSTRRDSSRSYRPASLAGFPSEIIRTSTCPVWPVSERSGPTRVSGGRTSRPSTARRSSPFVLGLRSCPSFRCRDACARLTYSSPQVPSHHVEDTNEGHGEAAPVIHTRAIPFHSLDLATVRGRSDAP